MTWVRKTVVSITGLGREVSVGRERGRGVGAPKASEP